MKDYSKLQQSIFVSGVESDRYWGIVVDEAQHDSVLISYHYFQNKPVDVLAKRLEKSPDVTILVDSGAYTFKMTVGASQQKPESYWTTYIEKYLEWAKANKDYIFAIANLDIELVVGADKVMEWNAKYFEPFERETGILVCYIWHEDSGASWEQYCKEYTYVGFSSIDGNQTVQGRMKLINVAKRYGTIVHGMALTETDLLVRIPMFSADSTTWLVGQKFGELNWFDGRGMKRLSKPQWRREYKTRLLKPPFNADWDKLINGMGGRGDTYELLRLNVIAFKLAEEHIRKRNNAKMYWKTGKTTNEPTKSLKDVSLPDYEWFSEGDQENYQVYMRGLTLPLTLEKEEAVDLLYNFYLYLKDDGTHLEEVPDEELITYAKEFIKSPVSDREGAISVIRKFFSDNATGVRTDFADDLEDGGQGRPKERDIYVNEEEFLLMDLSPDDFDNLALPLPREDDMPEVDAYDEELSKQGIVAVRDMNGRFLKGQKKVRKPKNMYSEKYPKLACDTCYKSGDCPDYKPGYVCAFNKMFKRFDTRDISDVVDAMQSMANSNLERMQRAMMFEIMDGGMATPEVSGLIDQNMRLLKEMKELANHTPKTILHQKRTLREDGSQEIVTEMNVNPQEGGILSKIFGASSRNTKDSRDDDIIEGEYEVKESDQPD